MTSSGASSSRCRFAEAGFQSFLELAEEVSVLRHVVNINATPMESSSNTWPHGAIYSHGLGFPHHGAELKSHS